MLFKWNDEITCLVTVDNLGTTIEQGNMLRESVSSVLGNRKDQIIVCFSHTHSAPNTIYEQYFDMEIQFFVLNEGCLCGVSMEPFCEIALEISKKTDNPLLLFGGYTNACNAYFPTKTEYSKGGYEVLYSILLYYKYHG